MSALKEPFDVDVVDTEKNGLAVSDSDVSPMAKDWDDKEEKKLKFK
jgi:hypothetical protein